MFVIDSERSAITNSDGTKALPIKVEDLGLDEINEKLGIAVNIIKNSVYNLTNDKRLADLALRVISSDKTLVKKLSSLLKVVDQNLTTEIVNLVLEKIKKEYSSQLQGVDGENA
jgi:ABC-type dipeptide/oligopeptide/nickel transport system ATPase subunit